MSPDPDDEFFLRVQPTPFDVPTPQAEAVTSAMSNLIRQMKSSDLSVDKAWKTYGQDAYRRCSEAEQWVMLAAVHVLISTSDLHVHIQHAHYLDAALRLTVDISGWPPAEPKTQIAQALITLLRALHDNAP